MKSIIETSVYCIVICLGCFIFINFIVMNKNVNKVNEVTNYIQDYIEIQGNCEHDGKGGYILNQDTLDFIENKAYESGMSVTYEYDTYTADYVYFRINVAYCLAMPVFHLSKQSSYHAYARAVKLH